MARSLLQYTVRSSSIIYIALRTPLRANSGYTPNSSIKPSILSSLGLPSCVFLVRFYRFCLRTSLSFVLCLVQGNFFISFFVLTNALEDPTIFGGKAIEVLNTILKYSYVGLLLTCFILALGNRPQGSSRTYTLAFIGYAIFTLYMTVCYRD
jgi:hypothetical protein